MTPPSLPGRLSEKELAAFLKDTFGTWGECQTPCSEDDGWLSAARAISALPGPAWDSKWQLVQVHECLGYAEVTVRSNDGRTVYEGALPLFPYPEQRR